MTQAGWESKGHRVGKMETGHTSQVEMLMVIAEQNSHWMARRIGMFGGFLAVVKDEVCMRSS